jgi:hypothetical protein
MVSHAILFLNKRPKEQYSHPVASARVSPPNEVYPRYVAAASATPKAALEPNPQLQQEDLAILSECPFPMGQFV